MDLRLDGGGMRGNRATDFFPAAMPRMTMDFLTDAIIDGNVTMFDLDIRGPLFKVPYDTPEEWKSRENTFRIAFNTKDTT